MYYPMRAFPIVMALITCLPCAHVGAKESTGVCCDPLQDWLVNAGELGRGVACGTFIGTTDAGNGPFSYGHFTRRATVELPYEFEVTWRGLSSDGSRPMELGLLGAMVLIANEKCGLFVSDESFVWEQLPGYDTLREHTVMARQDAKEITLFVDGRKAHIWPFAAPTQRGEVAVAFKGTKGYRSRLLFRDVHVRPAVNAAGVHGSPRTNVTGNIHPRR